MFYVRSRQLESMLLYLSKKEQKVLDALLKYTDEVYIVGGAVRDYFLNIAPNDYDIVTILTPSEILKILKKELPNTSLNLVGKSFGVVICDGLEIATFRKDRYHKNTCTVEYAKTINDDVSCRDLTICSICFKIRTGELVDDFNGLFDLKNKVIRLVGNPQEHINEDPARIIRACWFLAKIEGFFEKETLKALKQSAHYVEKYVAKERVRQELLKAMELKTPSLFFGALYISGALKYIFPELCDGVQHTHGKWHEEDIWEHNMLAGDAVSPNFPLVRLAAFLHDIGKSQAYIENDGENFANHEQIGARIVRERLTEFKFSNSEIDIVSNLVLAHMWGGGPEGMSPRAVRKLRKNFVEKGINSRDWMRLRIADRNSNIKKEGFSISEIKDCVRMVGIRGSEEPDIPFIVNNLAVKGGEIISHFNLAPSPIVGKLQKALLEYLVDNGVEYNEKDILLERVSVLLQDVKP